MFLGTKANAMGIFGKHNVAIIIGLFVIGVLAVVTPNITFKAISNFEEIDIPDITEGTEITNLGQKFSKYNGVIVSTRPSISCYWKSADNDDGYKQCTAIFEIEGTSGSETLLENPEILLDFEKEESVRNVEIAYSQEFEVAQEEHIEFEEETHEKREIQEIPTFTITGQVIRTAEEPKRSLKDTLKESRKTGKSRKSIKQVTTKIKKRSFTNFFKIPATTKTVTEIPGENDSNKTQVNQTIQNEASPPNQTENETEESIQNRTNATSHSPVNKTESLKVETPSEEASSTQELVPNSTLASSEDILSNRSEGIESQSNKTNISSGENETKKQATPISLLTGHVLRFLSPRDTIDISRPFAVQVTFEIPKYEQNQFNFQLVDAGYEAKIDPDVSGCGTLNTSDSTYTVTTSINASGTCFTFDAENITLDCQDNTLTYGIASAGYGVYSEYDDTTVKNCRIIEGNASISYGYGVYLSGNNGGTIENNTIIQISSTGAGVYLDGSSVNTIANMTINTTGTHGIYVSTSSDSAQVLTNTIHATGDSEYGVAVASVSSNANITGNHITTQGESGHGINIISSSSSNIELNTITATGTDAASVYAENAPIPNITSNTLTTTGEDGYAVYITISNDSTTHNNTIAINGEGGLGIFTEDSKRANISYNVVTSAQDSPLGIEISLRSNAADVRDNVVTMSGSDGYAMVIETSSHEGYYHSNTVNYTGNNGFGFMIDAASNNTIINQTVHTYGTATHALYLSQNTFNNSIENATFEANAQGAYSFYVWRNQNYVNCTNCNTASADGTADAFIGALATAGEWNFTNASIQTVNWSSGATGRLNTFEPMTVKVKNATGTPISGVHVTAYNQESTLVLNLTTNAQGKIFKTLPELFQNSSTYQTWQSNYTVNTTYNATTVSAQINLSVENEVALIFENDSAPISGSGGAGGGGGGAGDGEGGSGDQDCSASWSCTAWSSCSGGVQTRTCTNLTACTVNEPQTQRSCGSGKRDTLFDINIELLETNPTKDEPLAAKIGLLNIGVPGEVSANLYYEIRDQKGEIVLVQRETVQVQTQTEFIKNFNISKLDDGQYNVQVELTYESQLEPAEAQAQFQIGDKKTTSQTVVILVVSALIILLAVLFILRKRYRSKQE